MTTPTIVRITSPSGYHTCIACPSQAIADALAESLRDWQEYVELPVGRVELRETVQLLIGMPCLISPHGLEVHPWARP